MGQDNQFRCGCRFREQRLCTTEETDVHPQTLKSWIKNRIESGKEHNFDLFGVYQGNRAKIKEVGNEPSCTERPQM